MDAKDVHDEQLLSAYVRWTSIFSLVGIGLVIVTRFARPLPEGTGPLIVLVAGVLPNFGAALALPFAGVIWVARVLRVKRWSLSRLFFAMALLTFVGLTAWEVVQLVAWGYPFDVNDIVATALGVLGTFIIHGLISARHNRAFAAQDRA